MSSVPVTGSQRALAILCGALLALAVLGLAGSSAIAALLSVTGGPDDVELELTQPDTMTVAWDGAPLRGAWALPKRATLDPDADLVVFWGDGCPNCDAQEVWLAQVEQQHPDLNIVRYEVWFNEANKELFESEAQRLGFDAVGVPTTIASERVWIGWSPQIEQDMSGAVAVMERGEVPRGGVFGTSEAGSCVQDDAMCGTQDSGLTINAPVFGEITLNADSLLVSTIIIGFVDGVNPCSLWVLSVLLAIVLRTRSRRRVLAIGTTFLAVTTIMYALYMAAMYSALAVVGFMGWIQIVVALVAATFGVVSVKDYFAFGKGLSFTIRDKDKPGIYQRMRKAANTKALIPALGATVVLAVGVSLLETPCTAGFPVLWTGMLHANGVGAAETVGLFVAYMVPFLLDELIIFGLAVATMRAAKFQEKHGELLKLFAGVTMLALAAVMLINPALMENPLLALGLFAAAFALATVIHVVTARVRRARGAASGEVDSPGTQSAARSSIE